MEVDVVYMGVIHISRCLKEKLAWTTGKWLHVISKIMLFKLILYY